jgi:hypothetical protein
MSMKPVRMKLLAIEIEPFVGYCYGMLADIGT